MSKKKILGLDLGSNSLGWALYEEDNDDLKLIDLGSRIFQKAVEEKVPTPKNVKRRDMRLGRRVLQRRSRRRQRMLNYLTSLNLLPEDLLSASQPEVILNSLGDPYELRAKALDQPLAPYEFGRILLHFSARRGFLSSKKQASGDLIDDPDTISYINELDETESVDKEEGAFKADIAELKKAIESNSRTLGEYLYKLGSDESKRNRQHDGGHLRTDRKMYQDELKLIWEQQKTHFKHLPVDFMEENHGIQQIIFYQRPLKLKNDRIGRCSLEPKKCRALMARLEVQRFRYFQDINNLKYFERNTDSWLSVSDEDRVKLVQYMENHSSISSTAIKKELGLDRSTKLNLEGKNIKGNITAYAIKSIIGEKWSRFIEDEKAALVEDLISIKKKSALKNRLLNHWRLSNEQAVKLCLLEFESTFSNLSLKAINKLLPFLRSGLVFSDARIQAGYGYEQKEKQCNSTLGVPPKTSNPIVNKGMHELRRVINAIIKHYGKPDVVRVEMARDLEMNTKRYKENEARQAKNKKENEKAVKAYNDLGLGKYPSHDDKIKYRLWHDQNFMCAYSGLTIKLNDLFSSNIEIDHILPYKKSLDDSYMNKVICLTSKNREKSDRTPKDTWGGNEEKWNQITQAIQKWKGLDAKVKRFYQTEDDLMRKDDFISSQLNDTRYISKLAIEYIKTLGCDVTTTKGIITSWLRHQWGLNSLLGETDQKERTDHRHHSVDAAVIACVDRRLHAQIVAWSKNNERSLKVLPPYYNYREELSEHLQHVIISHAPLIKLSGGLHEETGAGFVAAHQGLVYRKRLDSTFTDKNANAIVDEQTRECVLAHLGKYGGDSKKAFADDVTVYHKNGKTPIKRVRVLQSKTSLKDLEKNKFGIKDKEGKVFKWMVFGNIHHVEIVKNLQNGKYKGHFVTMMQASHRAKGINSSLNPDGLKQGIIQTNHGDDWLLELHLHKNDIVSIPNKLGERVFYRVQGLDRDGSRLELRLHSAASISNKVEGIRKSISGLMESGMQKHKINALGVFSDDKESNRYQRSSLSSPQK